MFHVPSPIMEDKLLEYIYDDVDDSDIFVTETQNNSFSENQAKETDFTTSKAADLVKEIEDLREALKKQQAEKELLETRISEIYVTAKAEIARKDRRVQELQEEINNFVFRRNRKFNQSQKFVPNVTEAIEKESEKNLTNEEFQRFNSEYRIPKRKNSDRVESCLVKKGTETQGDTVTISELEKPAKTVKPTDKLDPRETTNTTTVHSSVTNTDLNQLDIHTKQKSLDANKLASDGTKYKPLTSRSPNNQDKSRPTNTTTAQITFPRTPPGSPPRKSPQRDSKRRSRSMSREFRHVNRGRRSRSKSQYDRKEMGSRRSRDRYRQRRQSMTAGEGNSDKGRHRRPPRTPSGSPPRKNAARSSRRSRSLSKVRYRNRSSAEKDKPILKHHEVQNRNVSKIGYKEKPREKQNVSPKFDKSVQSSRDKSSKESERKPYKNRETDYRDRKGNQQESNFSKQLKGDDSRTRYDRRRDFNKRSRLRGTYGTKSPERDKHRRDLKGIGKRESSSSDRDIPRKDSYGNPIYHRYKDWKNRNKDVETSDQLRNSMPRDLGVLRQKILKHSLEMDSNAQKNYLRKNQDKLGLPKGNETDHSDLDDLRLHLSGASDEVSSIEGAKDRKMEIDEDFELVKDLGPDVLKMNDHDLERLLETRLKQLHGDSISLEKETSDTEELTEVDCYLTEGEDMEDLNVSAEPSTSQNRAEKNKWENSSGKTQDNQKIIARKEVICEINVKEELVKHTSSNAKPQTSEGGQQKHGEKEIENESSEWLSNRVIQSYDSLFEKIHEIKSEQLNFRLTKDNDMHIHAKTNNQHNTEDMNLTEKSSKDPKLPFLPKNDQEDAIAAAIEKEKKRIDLESYKKRKETQLKGPIEDETNLAEQHSDKNNCNISQQPKSQYTDSAVRSSKESLPCTKVIDNINEEKQDSPVNSDEEYDDRPISRSDNAEANISSRDKNSFIHDFSMSEDEDGSSPGKIGVIDSIVPTTNKINILSITIVQPNQPVAVLCPAQANRRLSEVVDENDHQESSECIEQIEEAVRNTDVFLDQSLCNSSNTMEKLNTEELQKYLEADTVSTKGKQDPSMENADNSEIMIESRKLEPKAKEKNTPIKEEKSKQEPWIPKDTETFKQNTPAKQTVSDQMKLLFGDITPSPCNPPSPIRPKQSPRKRLQRLQGVKKNLMDESILIHKGIITRSRTKLKQDKKSLGGTSLGKQEEKLTKMENEISSESFDNEERKQVDPEIKLTTFCNHPNYIPNLQEEMAFHSSSFYIRNKINEYKEKGEKKDICEVIDQTGSEQIHGWVEKTPKGKKHSKKRNSKDPNTSQESAEKIKPTIEDRLRDNKSKTSRKKKRKILQFESSDDEQKVKPTKKKIKVKLGIRKSKKLASHSYKLSEPSASQPIKENPLLEHKVQKSHAIKGELKPPENEQKQPGKVAQEISNNEELKYKEWPTTELKLETHNQKLKEPVIKCNSPTHATTEAEKSERKKNDQKGTSKVAQEIGNNEEPKCEMPSQKRLKLKTDNQNVNEPSSKPNSQTRAATEENPKKKKNEQKQTSKSAQYSRNNEEPEKMEIKTPTKARLNPKKIEQRETSKAPQEVRNEESECEILSPKQLKLKTNNPKVREPNSPCRSTTEAEHSEKKENGQEGTSKVAQEIGNNKGPKSDTSQKEFKPMTDNQNASEPSSKRNSATCATTERNSEKKENDQKQTSSATKDSGNNENSKELKFKTPTKEEQKIKENKQRDNGKTLQEYETQSEMKLRTSIEILNESAAFRCNSPRRITPVRVGECDIAQSVASNKRKLSDSTEDSKPDKLQKMIGHPNQSPLPHMEEMLKTFEQRTNDGNEYSANIQRDPNPPPLSCDRRQSVFNADSHSMHDKSFSLKKKSDTVDPSSNDNSFPEINLDTKDVVLLGTLEQGIFDNMSAYLYEKSLQSLEAENKRKKVNPSEQQKHKNAKEGDVQLNFAAYLNKNTYTSTPIKKSAQIISATSTAVTETGLDRSHSTDTINVSDDKISSESGSPSKTASFTKRYFMAPLRRDRRKKLTVTMIDIT